jgi:hypothetical protein
MTDMVFDRTRSDLLDEVELEIEKIRQGSAGPNSADMTTAIVRVQEAIKALRLPDVSEGCTPFVWKHYHRPALSPHAMLSDDCSQCGHLLALHSEARGCIGCRLEPS